MATNAEIIREHRANTPWFQEHRTQGYHLIRAFDRASAEVAVSRAEVRRTVALMRQGNTDRTTIEIVWRSYRDAQRKLRLWAQHVIEQRDFEANIWPAQARAAAAVGDAIGRALYGSARPATQAAE